MQNIRRNQEIQQWLVKPAATDRNVIALDMLGDVGRIPFPWFTTGNQTLTACVPAIRRPGKPFCELSLRPRRRQTGQIPCASTCLLDGPSVILAADPDLLAKVPGEQRNLLSDWAIANELTVVD